MRAAILVGPSLILLVGTSGGQDKPANPLAGKRFLSLEKLIGGDRPDGTINRIHWVIAFKAKEYSWTQRDVIVSGTYEHRSSAATKEGRADVRRGLTGGAAAWRNGRASVPGFRRLHAATRGTHCRPPGPPASLSLFRRGSRLGLATGGGLVGAA